MSDMPRVGVVVGTYKRPEQLQVMLRSLLRQTFRDFEVMVVDDASKTAVIACEQLESEFEKEGIMLSVCELDENSGAQPKPRNAGYQLLKNPLVAFVDDDDELLMNHLQVHVDKHDEFPDVCLTYGRFRVKHTSDHDRMKEIPEGWESEYVQFNYFQLKAGPRWNFVNSYVMVKRALIEEAFPDSRPWDEEIVKYADWKLAWELTKRKKIIKGVDAVTFIYCFDGTNRSLTMNSRGESNDLIEEFSEMMGSNKPTEEVLPRWQGLRSVL